MAELLGEDRKLREARPARGKEAAKRPDVPRLSVQYSVQNLLHGLRSSTAALQELTRTCKKFTYVKIQAVPKFGFFAVSR